MQPYDLGLPLTTDVGRLVPVLAEEDAQSEASEWEVRERIERDDERRVEVEELGEKLPLFLPAPSLMVSTEEE
jgi:hypothetical protein